MLTIDTPCPKITPPLTPAQRVGFSGDSAKSGFPPDFGPIRSETGQFYGPGPQAPSRRIEGSSTWARRCLTHVSSLT